MPEIDIEPTVVAILRLYRRAAANRVGRGQLDAPAHHFGVSRRLWTPLSRRRVALTELGFTLTRDAPGVVRARCERGATMTFAMRNCLHRLGLCISSNH